jgi:ribosomal RNA methyltransferase Nop2
MRMGCSNSVVTCMDGRKYPKYMTNFDRILLDAPCSGLGIISRDPAIKTSKVLLYELNLLDSQRHL